MSTRRRAYICEARQRLAELLGEHPEWLTTIAAAFEALAEREAKA